MPVRCLALAALVALVALTACGVPDSGLAPAATVTGAPTVLPQTTRAPTPDLRPTLAPLPPLAFAERAPRLLNAPLPDGGRVVFYRLTPDGARSLYVADQRVPGQFELWSVPVAGGPPLRLSEDLRPNEQAALEGIVPQGDIAVYMIYNWAASTADVYAVPVAGGPSRLLGHAVGEPGRSPEVRLARGGERALFLTDASGQLGIASVPLRGGDAVILDHPELPRSVLALQIDDAGKHIVFRGASDGALRSAPAAGGPPVVLVPAETVDAEYYLLSPRGDAVAYLTYGQLYSVPVGGGEEVRLSRSPHPEADPNRVEDFRFAPDGETVLYLAPQRSPRALTCTRSRCAAASRSC